MSAHSFFLSRHQELRGRRGVFRVQNALLHTLVETHARTVAELHVTKCDVHSPVALHSHEIALDLELSLGTHNERVGLARVWRVDLCNLGSAHQPQRLRLRGRR